MGKRRAVARQEEPETVQDPSPPLPRAAFQGLLTTAVNALDEARLAAVHRRIDGLPDDEQTALWLALGDLAYRLDALRGKV